MALEPKQIKDLPAKTYNSNLLISVQNSTGGAGSTGHLPITDIVGNVGTVTSVGLTTATNGLSITASPITTSGNINVDLNSELQAFSQLSSNGIICRTGAGAYSPRTLSAGSGISITNGNGVSGNPTITNSGVLTFNTRAGDVTLTSGDVTTALTYTPYNGAINPNGYISGVTLTGDVTGSGSTIATTLASTISRASGQTFNYGNSNANSFFNMIISNSAVTKSTFSMGQNVTIQSGYVWTYSRPIVSPIQVESLILSQVDGSTPLIGFSRADSYATIFQGLHMNSKIIDGISQALYSKVTGIKDVYYETASNPHQYYGVKIGSGTLGYQIDSANSKYVFSAAEGASSSLDIFEIYGSGSAALIGGGTFWPGKMPHGCMFMEANSTATTITTGNAFVKVSGTTSSINLNQFTMPSNNRLTYTGPTTIVAKVAVTASIAQNQAFGTIVTISIYKNGTRVGGTNSAATITNATNYLPIPVVFPVSMSTNDYIEIFVTSGVDTSTVTVANLQVVVTTI